jgi:beta-lactamase class A
VVTVRRPCARRALSTATAALIVALASCGGTKGFSSTPVTTPTAASDRSTPRTDRVADGAASRAADPAIVTTPDPVADASASAESGSAATEGRMPGFRAAKPILSRADRESFQRLATSLGGISGVAASGLGKGRKVESVGAFQRAIAWSTAKVPVAMAVIAAGNATAQRDNLRGAITASDNAAAMRLWSSLGGGQRAASAADEQLRHAGDAQTRIESRPLRGPAYTPFGQTSWALSDQTRFTAGMACTTAGEHVLGLMNQVVAGQRWGLGSAGVSAQLKGGWGPGSEPGSAGAYLDRQMGVLKIHGRPIAVAIATVPADGSHETGTHNLTQIARWLVSHASTDRLPRRPTGC